MSAQLRFSDLGISLQQVPFVVVDLETTGGSPQHSAITEIGAVRIEGGEVTGEFHSLVDPGMPIPASIAALTGITNGLVAGWPPIEGVLPAFLEFSRGAAFVAHNARFDLGFLNANLARLAYPPLAAPVVCTAALARRLVRDEVRNVKLATLAQFFRCRTTPTHRALDDARATVEVFYGLLERAGSFGVLTLEDLIQFARVSNAPLFKARRGLADGLPHEPGVYAFRSASGEVLYVGKASNLRERVRQYFGSDSRRKITDMMKETASLDHWVCPTPIEAAVRELRLIHAHQPRFNRQGKRARKGVWLRLTGDSYPRLSVVRSQPPDDVPALGPLPSRRVAEQFADAVRGLDTDDVARVLDGDPAPAAEPMLTRMRALAADGRFEEAADVRDRLHALVSALRRMRRLHALADSGALIAGKRHRNGTTELLALRDGRLVASVMAAADGREAAIAALRAALDQTVLADPEAESVAAQEADLLGRWLEDRGVRIELAEGYCAEPIAGGLLLADAHARLTAAQRGTARPADELAAKRRRLPTL